MISVTSEAGRPRAVSTISMVTRPALGMEAAPMEARVAVKLERKRGVIEIRDEE